MGGVCFIAPLLVYVAGVFILGTNGHHELHEKHFQRSIKTIDDNGFNLEGLKKEYIAALISLSKTLPKKKLCLTVLRSIKNPTHPLIKKVWNLDNGRHRRSPCKKFKTEGDVTTTTDSEVDVDEKLTTIDAMVRLYNQLPLPFQCNILTTTTLNYLEHRRMEHINEKKDTKINEVEREEEEISRPSIIQRSKTLMKSIGEAERLLSGYNLLPVTQQCQRLVRKQNAFSKSIYVTVKRTAEAGDLLEEVDVDRNLRKIIPKIVEDYVKQNGIKIGLSLIDRHWVTKLDSLIFISIKEQNSTSSHFRFKCKLFLALGNTGPISANLVIAALYDYGKGMFTERTGLDIDFSLALDDDRPVPQSINPLFQQELFMKQVFPKYLSKYFKRLDTSEKEYLLELVSLFSNQTKTRIIEMLQKERGLILAKFLQVRKRRLKYFSKSHEFLEAEREAVAEKTLLLIKSKNNKKTLFITKLTNIEIIMIVALAFLFIFSIVFVSTFVLFQRRKKEYQRKMMEVQNLMYKDTHVIIQKKMIGCNCDSSSTLQTDPEYPVKGFETFCTRTRRYSEQHPTRLNTLVRSDLNRVQGQASPGNESLLL